MAIEGEYSSSLAQRKASGSALRRVEEGIAHIGIAVVYPREISLIGNPAKLKKTLASSMLQFAIITEIQQPEFQQLAFLLEPTPSKPIIAFVEGDLNALVDALRRSYEKLIEEEVLERAVQLMQESTQKFLLALQSQPATAERFQSAMDVRVLPQEKSKNKKKEKPE
jgi:hypothetical protein